MLIKVYVLLKGMDVFINVVKRVELIGNVIYKICYGIVCLKKRDEINNQDFEKGEEEKKMQISILYRSIC